MSRSSSTSISSSGISSSWGGGRGETKARVGGEGFERGLLAEAPALLWEEPALCAQQTAAAALRKKTDQALAKENCPMGGRERYFLSLPVGHPRCQTARAGDPGLGILQMCLPNFWAPHFNQNRWGQLSQLVSPFPSPKHLSQLPRSEEEVQGEGSARRTQAGKGETKSTCFVVGGCLPLLQRKHLRSGASSIPGLG